MPGKGWDREVSQGKLNREVSQGVVREVREAIQGSVVAGKAMIQVGRVSAPYHLLS